MAEGWVMPVRRLYQNNPVIAGLRHALNCSPTVVDCGAVILERYCYYCYLLWGVCGISVFILDGSTVTHYSALLIFSIFCQIFY